MAAVTQLDLLARLAAGTAGVVGKAFLRRLVTELAGALGAEVAFVAELLPEHRARTIASAGPLREGHEFGLAGTPCEDAYGTDLLLVAQGARARYPEEPCLAAHGLDGYLAVALHDARGEAIGHLGVIASGRLDPEPSELQALRVFASRAGAELERRRHEDALAETRARALAIEHADTSELRLRVAVEGDVLVTIGDDGSGGACETRGTGLRGLRARVESLGGELQLACERGTTLTARLPLR
jgi:GAF domain-containing protein